MNEFLIANMKYAIIFLAIGSITIFIINYLRQKHIEKIFGNKIDKDESVHIDMNTFNLNSAFFWNMAVTIIFFSLSFIFSYVYDNQMSIIQNQLNNAIEFHEDCYERAREDIKNELKI